MEKEPAQSITELNYSFQLDARLSLLESRIKALEKWKPLVDTAITEITNQLDR